MTYARTKQFNQGSLARGSDVRFELDTIASAMSTLETDLEAQITAVLNQVTGAAMTTYAKINYAAGASPGVGDDSDDDYGVGSIWIDITNDRAWMCLDASVGAAVWREFALPLASTAEAQAGTETDVRAWAPDVVKDAIDSLAASGLTYTEVTSATNLAVNTAYYDKSGAHTHVLPELSGTTDGEKIRVYVEGSNHTVTINEHANDSNAEIATLYAEGDYVWFIVVDGAWHVENERVTVYGRAALTSDDAVINTTEKIFDANYAVDEDVGNWWDSVTNHRLNIAFDCCIDITIHEVVNDNDLKCRLAVNGALQDDISGAFGGGIVDGSLNTLHYQLHLSSGKNVTVHATGTTASPGGNVMGDAAKDETRLVWNLQKRVR